MVVDFEELVEEDGFGSVRDEDFVFVEKVSLAAEREAFRWVKRVCMAFVAESCWINSRMGRSRG